MDERQNLQITLNADGVSQIMHRVVSVAADVVGTAIRALETDNCEAPTSWGATFGFKFADLGLPPEQRRMLFKNWILAKGFQDLARGVRETLEEAYAYIGLLQLHETTTTLEKFHEEMARLKSAASKLTFPALMEKVNLSLSEPMAFDGEFRSLQDVRNCLEHRAGKVEQKDVDPGTNFLTLSFPRLKIFYLRGEEEIEVVAGEVIDTHAPDNPFGTEGVEILARRVTRIREYALGDPVIIEATDFFEIAFACQLFSNDLASKLPRIAPSE